MSTEYLSLFMDLIVLAALGGTIYYARRLSNSLGNFRKTRNEMKTLIAELSKNINEAQGAIEGLKATSNIDANNLDDVLHDSRRMSEELKLINESSDNIANRLEGLISQTSRAQNFDIDDADEEFFVEPQAANEDDGPVDPPSFFIQDREFEEETDDDGFISEAEKELLAALKTNTKRGRG